uniref:Uncharacterized protein n=1 Tax=Mycena chlorophos TaxID=658473 RepID=A0ABQ0KUK7_MYCCL|nr:predicted protein [Mycena chlorophos]
MPLVRSSAHGQPHRTDHTTVSNELGTKGGRESLSVGLAGGYTATTTSSSCTLTATFCASSVPTSSTLTAGLCRSSGLPSPSTQNDDDAPLRTARSEPSLQRPTRTLVPEAAQRGQACRSQQARRSRQLERMPSFAGFTGLALDCVSAVEYDDNLVAPVPSLPTRRSSIHIRGLACSPSHAFDPDTPDVDARTPTTSAGRVSAAQSTGYNASAVTHVPSPFHSPFPACHPRCRPLHLPHLLVLRLCLQFLRVYIHKCLSMAEEDEGAAGIEAQRSLRCLPGLRLSSTSKAQPELGKRVHKVELSFFGRIRGSFAREAGAGGSDVGVRSSMKRGERDNSDDDDERTAIARVCSSAACRQGYSVPTTAERARGGEHERARDSERGRVSWWAGRARLAEARETYNGAGLGSPSAPVTRLVEVKVSRLDAPVSPAESRGRTASSSTIVPVQIDALPRGSIFSTPDVPSTFAGPDAVASASSSSTSATSNGSTIASAVAPTQLIAIVAPIAVKPIPVPVPIPLPAPVLNGVGNGKGKGKAAEKDTVASFASYATGIEMFEDAADGDHAPGASSDAEETETETETATNTLSRHPHRHRFRYRMGIFTRTPSPSRRRWPIR